MDVDHESKGVAEGDASGYGGGDVHVETVHVGDVRHSHDGYATHHVSGSHSRASGSAHGDPNYSHSAGHAVGVAHSHNAPGSHAQDSATGTGVGGGGELVGGETAHGVENDSDGDTKHNDAQGHGSKVDSDAVEDVAPAVQARAATPSPPPLEARWALDVAKVPAGEVRGTWDQTAFQLYLGKRPPQFHMLGT